MERALPTIARVGTEFVVDITQFVLREKSNPENCVFLQEMYDFRGGYVFKYNVKEKRIPTPRTRDYTPDVVYVKIPEFVTLDPVGMAEKYNLKIEEIKGKTDFDLLVDQKAFDMRANQGILPTIEMPGCIFCVDIAKGILRPEAVSASKGLVFSDFKDHLVYDDECYIIPYNTRTHEFHRLDYDSIIELPKDVILVAFLHESLMDPVGWNIHCGEDPKFALKGRDFNLRFTPDVVPWEKTIIPKIIAENVKKLQPQPKKEIKQPDKPQQKRGRKL